MNQNTVKSKTKKTQILTPIKDFVIREVRINYQPTKEAPFAIRAPADVARFVRSVLHDNAREHVVALYLDGAHQVTGLRVDFDWTGELRPCSPARDLSARHRGRVGGSGHRP